MSLFTPPIPQPLPDNTPWHRRFREALRSAIGMLRAGGYEAGVGRHKLPRLPGTKQRYSYTVRDPAVMREVLVERAADFPKSRLMYNMLAPLIGNSVFVSNGATWRKQRDMIDRAFEQARLRDVFPKMRDAADALCLRLDQSAAGDGPKGGEVTFDAEATHVAADIIFRTIFSETLDQATADDLFETFEDFQGLAYAHGMMSLARIPMAIMPGRRRAWRKARRMRKVLGDMLDRRIAGLAAGEPMPTDDILATLVQSVDPDTGEPVTRDALLNEIAMLFLAGHETSAAGLAWTIYILSECPDIQERVRQEVEELLGTRQIEYSDIRDLPFCRDVFREALRLYPPLAVITRDTVQPECLGKRNADADSVLFVQTWSLQRNREVWPNADAFDPDRWQCPYAKSAQRQAYLPFSLGPRVCVGAGFAMLEATLLIATITRNYKIKMITDNPAPIPTARLTLRSSNKIRVHLERIVN